MANKSSCTAIGSLSVDGSVKAAVTSAYTFTYNSGFNETHGGHALPHTVTKYSYAYAYPNLVINTPGMYTVVLTVDNVEKGRLVWDVRPVAPRKAKNVILFIGDGMNTGIITASRLLSRGWRHGVMQGELNMDTMDRLGYLSTNGYDSIVTDSANSAAAYASGHKGPVNSLNVYGDTSSSTLDDCKVEVIAELASRKYGSDFGIGVVTTSEIQDATPAAFFAHTRRRGDKAEITRQFLEGFNNGGWSTNPEIDVLLGGGGSYFYPKTMLNVYDANNNQIFCTKAPGSDGSCPVVNQTTDISLAVGNVTVTNGGNSLNGRNFYKEAADKGYSVVHNRADMLAASTKNKKLLGIFHYGNNDVWLDRHEKPSNIVKTSNPMHYTSYNEYINRPAMMDQPDLAEMTETAIKVLDRRNPDGFFLAVEGSSIDKAEHPFDNERAIDELIDMDNAIGVALQYARAHKDTLVLVTSDHGHGFDVVGTVDTLIFDSKDSQTTLPEDKKRVRASAVGIYNKAGAPDVVDVDGDGFPDNFATARYTLATGYADVVNMKEQYRVHSSYRNPSLGSAAGDFNKVNAADSNVVGGKNHGAGFIRNLADTNGVHTVQDVPLYGEGPAADQIKTAMANVDVFQIIASALGLGGN